MEGEKKEQPTYEELEETINKQCMEMARIQAENLRKDMTIQKLCKENGTSKKQLREAVKEKSTIEDQTKKELEIAKKELEIANISKQHVSMLGMSEEDADEAAKHRVDGDIESWFRVIEKHVKKVRMEAEQEAVQSFLTGRPDIKAGNGDADRSGNGSMRRGYSSFEQVRRHVSEKYASMGFPVQY